MEDKYWLLRQHLSSRKRLFNDTRTLTSYLCFKTWEALMELMLKSFKPPLRSPNQEAAAIMRIAAPKGHGSTCTNQPISMPVTLPPPVALRAPPH
jgi:hypothetical protein